MVLERYPPYLIDGPAMAHPASLASRLLETLPADPALKLVLAAEDKAVVAAALLVAAAGGPAVVLPHARSERVLQAAAEAAGTRLVLTDGPRQLPAGLEEIRCGGGSWTSEVTPSLPVGDSKRHSLWMYTGGTTGNPTLWPKSAGILLAEARLLAKIYGITKDDRILATVPSQHIYGLLFSVLLPLVSEARTANIVPYFPDEISTQIESLGATILVSSPAHYRAMAAVPPRRCSLRLAYSSGGFLSERDGARFCEAVGVGVTEVYGSTETGGIATRRRDLKEKFWTPLEPVRWRLDGERLAVKSPFLSPGLPLSADGYFTTGDRGAVGHAGRFDLLGRVDGVVKVGGKRVVLESVRARLLALPEIEDVAVVAIPSDHGRGSVLAVLFVGGANRVTVRSSFAAALEPHEVPRLIQKAKAIPRLMTGKEDRTAILSLAMHPDEKEEELCQDR